MQDRIHNQLHWNFHSPQTSNYEHDIADTMLGHCCLCTCLVNILCMLRVQNSICICQWSRPDSPPSRQQTRPEYMYSYPCGCFHLMLRCILDKSSTGRLRLCHCMCLLHTEHRCYWARYCSDPYCKQCRCVSPERSTGKNESLGHIHNARLQMTVLEKKSCRRNRCILLLPAPCWRICPVHKPRTRSSRYRPDTTQPDTPHRTCLHPGCHCTPHCTGTMTRDQMLCLESKNVLDNLHSHQMRSLHTTLLHTQYSWAGCVLVERCH